MDNLKLITVLTRNVKQWAFTLALLFAIGLCTTSCKSDDDSTSLEDVAAIDQKALETQAEVDKADEGINAIVEDVYFGEEIDNTRNPNNTFLPDCVTITSVIVDNTKTVTIDFGEGCELRNGNIASGIITIEYNRDVEELVKTIAVSFTNFYFNDKNIAGSKSLERMLENTNGNPQSTYTANITVTWPDGTFASSQGQKTREWIAGLGSGFWGDNVFLITGNWTFVRKNGTVLIGTITTPLRRELSCRFLVSGVVELSKNGNVATLNYGQGSCDPIGTITVNGSDHQIYLGD